MPLLRSISLTPVNQSTLTACAKYALAVVWIFTALTSIWFAPKIGYDILAGAGITGKLADISVYAGGLLDLLIGLWLLTGRLTRWCCLVQVVVIVLYTLLLSWIDAAYWLHPFGPVTKNLPIIVLIGFVYCYANDNYSSEN